MTSELKIIHVSRAEYTACEGETVRANATRGPVEIYLPDVNDLKHGYDIIVVKTDDSQNPITIMGLSGEEFILGKPHQEITLSPAHNVWSQSH